MVDNMTPMDQPIDEAPAKAKGLRGFAQSAVGKILLVVLLVVVLAGVAAALYFTLFASSSPSDTAVVTPPSSGKPAGQKGGKGSKAPEEPVEPPQVTVSDVFTFRDIFQATVSASIPSTATSGSAEASPTVPTPGDSTLFLQDIVLEDGEEVAVMYFSGTEYRVKEGDRLGDTPWEVLDIQGDTVVMLYGDSQVTLSVGQGMAK